MLGLTRAEFAVLRRLRTPEKIQLFLYGLKQNFERDGETCHSVRVVLRDRRAHCIEGALLAACALWIHGEPPLLLDLQAVRDFDHVVALFRRNGRWGAISKTNGIGLRWRDPVYRSLRELAMSYLHEYYNKRDHVIEVMHRLHVEQQRRLALDPQRAGRDHGTLDAVRAPLLQHRAHRVAGFALKLEILPQPVEKLLDLFRRAQAAQDREFHPAEPEHFTGSSCFSHRLHT